jgi:hypothetical protein
MSLTNVHELQRGQKEQPCTDEWTAMRRMYTEKTELISLPTSDHTAVYAVTKNCSNQRK